MEVVRIIKNFLVLFIIILIIIFSFIQSCYAEKVEVGKNTQKVICDDVVSIEFSNNTFNKTMTIECRKATKKEINKIKYKHYNKMPIYKLEITDQKGQKLEFTRNDITIYINTLNLTKYDRKDINSNTLFFYSKIIKGWIGMHSECYDNTIKAKLIHTGYFTIFEKHNNSNLTDIYKIKAQFFNYMSLIVLLICVIIIKTI